MKNFDLLNIILKWRITIAIVTGASILLSSVFSSSYFIKPKYKSNAVIYPSNLMPYSQESATEQMLQLFQSDSVFTHVVKYFDLIKHYSLDPTSASINYELLSMYNENVSIKKTEYEAVRIEVMDHDPNTACKMINEMIHAFNAFTLKLGKEKTIEQVQIVKDLLQRKEIQIDSINTALKELGVKFGIIEYASQSRELSKEYYRTLSTGNEKKINELTNSLRNLEERGGEFRKLQQYLEDVTKEYSILRNQYNILANDIQKKLTYTNVVVKPYPSDKKSYPIRWLIVTIATCASLLFTLIIIMIVEGRKNNSQ